MAKKAKFDCCSVSISFLIVVVTLMCISDEVYLLAMQTLVSFTGLSRPFALDKELFSTAMKTLGEKKIGNNIVTLGGELPPDNCGAHAAADVMKFGAVGDGITDDTEAVQKAILALKVNPMFRAGVEGIYTAALLFPEGYSFYLDKLVIDKLDGLIFCVMGRIMAHNNFLEPECPFEGSPMCTMDLKGLTPEQKRIKHSFITVKNSENIVFAGHGKIDGRGENWWVKRKEAPELFAPVLLSFVDCVNVYIGHLDLTDSALYHISLNRVQWAVIEHLYIHSPPWSLNTDGISILASSFITARKNWISSGDDNVSIKDNCTDILLEDNVFAEGHGAAIGDLGLNKTNAFVMNVTVRDSVFTYTQRIGRIKTWQGGRGLVQNITFDNLYAHKVHTPIVVDQFYCPLDQHDGNPCGNKTRAVSINGVNFNNIKGTHTSGLAGSMICADTAHCTDIWMNDVSLHQTELGLTNAFQCWNAEGESHDVYPLDCLNRVNLPPFVGERARWSLEDQFIFFCACSLAFAQFIRWSGLYWLVWGPFYIMCCKTGFTRPSKRTESHNKALGGHSFWRLS